MKVDPAAAAGPSRTAAEPASAVLMVTARAGHTGSAPTRTHGASLAGAAAQSVASGSEHGTLRSLRSALCMAEARVGHVMLWA